MISMLALIGGITGMFLLFGLAWKLLKPTLDWETLDDEIGSPPKAGGTGPAPIARNTITYGVPPLPAPPKPGPLASMHPPTRRPPIAPPLEDEDMKTHFFDRALLPPGEVRLEPTEVLSEEPNDRTGRTEPMPVDPDWPVS